MEQPQQTVPEKISLSDIPRDVLIHHLCPHLSAAQVLALLFVSKRLKNAILSRKDTLFLSLHRPSVWKSVFITGDTILLPWLQIFLKYPQCDSEHFSSSLPTAAKGSDDRHSPWRSSFPSFFH
jgi:hypothetical protein